MVAERLPSWNIGWCFLGGLALSLWRAGQRSPRSGPVPHRPIPAEWWHGDSLSAQQAISRQPAHRFCLGERHIHVERGCRRSVLAARNCQAYASSLILIAASVALACLNAFLRTLSCQLPIHRFRDFATIFTSRALCPVNGPIGQQREFGVPEVQLLFLRKVMPATGSRNDRGLTLSRLLALF